MYIQPAYTCLAQLAQWPMLVGAYQVSNTKCINACVHVICQILVISSSCYWIFLPLYIYFIKFRKSTKMFYHFVRIYRSLAVLILFAVFSEFLSVSSSGLFCQFHNDFKFTVLIHPHVIL